METITPHKLKILKPVNVLLSIFYHTKKNNNKVDFEQTKKIIVLDPTAIGDIVMLIPFLKVLRNNFKKAEITLVCAKHAEVILKDLNLVDKFIIFNGNNSFLSIKNIIKERKHLKETLSVINKNNYDIALEPRGDIRYLFFMHYFKAKRKISFSYSGGECFLTNVYNMPDNYKNTHIIEDKLYLLKKIGCKISKEDYYPVLNKDLNLKNEFIKNNYLENLKLIGIHPGASKLIRQYPYYDKVVEKINSKNLCFLIFKGYNEEETVKKIEKKLKAIKAKYLVINETLEMYIKLLGICDLVICNDSGAGHLAGAYGIKTYVFFGPERPSGIRPYNDKNVEYINYDVECKPCYCLDCQREEQLCFTKINLDKVCAKIKKDIEKMGD